MSFDITAAIASIKTAKDLVSIIKSMSKDVAVNDKAIELQNIILNIQSDMLAMQEEKSLLLDAKRDLEKQLMEIIKWEKAETVYELFQLQSGSVVRVPNEGNQSPYHKHWLCANCFEKKQKSFLQRTRLNDPAEFKCPACGANVILHWHENDNLK